MNIPDRITSFSLENINEYSEDAAFYNSVLQENSDVMEMHSVLIIRFYESDALRTNQFPEKAHYNNKLERARSEMNRIENTFRELEQKYSNIEKVTKELLTSRYLTNEIVELYKGEVNSENILKELSESLKRFKYDTEDLISHLPKFDKRCLRSSYEVSLGKKPLQIDSEMTGKRLPLRPENSLCLPLKIDERSIRTIYVNRSLGSSRGRGEKQIWLKDKGKWSISDQSITWRS